MPVVTGLFSGLVASPIAASATRFAQVASHY